MRLSSIWRLVLPLLLLAAILPVGTSLGQQPAPPPTLQIERLAVPAPSAPAPVLVAPLPAATTRVYLPLMRTPRVVTVRFAASIDGDNNLINPATTFPYGITNLYYEVRIRGAIGQPYRVHLDINGESPLPDDVGTLTSNDAISVVRLYYDDNTPLDRGRFEISVFIGDTLYQQGSAVIQ